MSLSTHECRLSIIAELDSTKADCTRPQRAGSHLLAQNVRVAKGRVPPRAMAVPYPLPVVIDNYSERQLKEFSYIVFGYLGHIGLTRNSRECHGSV